MTYKALAVDPRTHDLTFINGSLAMVSNSEAIAQRVKQHLRMYAGEWFLDTSVGVPWIEYVFTNPFDQAIAEAIVKDAVLAVPGVVEILSFGANFYPRNRQFDIYEMQIRTEFDEVVTLNG